MKQIPCNSCGATFFKHLFQKKSSKDETFQIVKCQTCGLVQVNPQPSMEEVAKYYSDDYFTKRTDRGYDNYYSDKIRSEIERVFRLNLEDLDFFEWVKTLSKTKRTIDIGCAAGYFVNFMKSQGWEAEGIEIAEGPVRFAREVLQLPITKADFLNWDNEVKKKFELITLWASIEHLHKPKETLEKIYSHLEPGGRMILSTCRYGILAWITGINWRYMNVPEHLYYYSLKGIIKECERIGFKKISSITYGSGMTARKNSSFFYRTVKKFMDWFVKWTNQGDMMAIQFEK
ncbi:MAG: class I SAM-dependent methyltransferase [Leptospiraceae bacterium]|nr:class I SAM-dependent methyltransferase [Leptospiraceae bacterium]MBK7056068.1 class I SAM-dependent methyltransferase [Leptospiraceae bacterium]MBK9498090.1 class I SAM-dependent methyltransferase [Leptospiraceae bacterium]MBP9165649.1 class I SAM-dependent methyltransferase [Leptospiraceae bacterium]